jgi:sucrose-6-phosphate hydrolase SacC (GH32 family)
MERGLSTLAGEPVKDFQRVNVSETGDGARGDLDLLIFLDHSIIEIFINGREAMTGRVYPVLPDSDGVSVSGRLAVGRISIKQVE